MTPCKSPRRSVRLLAFGVLALLIVASAWPQDTVAQRKRSFYEIHISKQQGTCLYEIKDHSDPDFFAIEPHGVVDFHAIGTNARVEIRSSDAGVPGASGDKDLKLKADGPPKVLRARGPRQRSTEHKVYIRCCEGTGLGRCANAQEAQPAPQATGMRSIEYGGFAEQFAGTPGGPNALDILIWASTRVVWPLPGGGPIMKVDED